MKRIRTLGKGGLGIVSLYQSNNGQNFAVKQMLYQWDENYYERFKREVEIMATLVHKNIVNVLNFNILNNNPWYLMPYYDYRCRQCGHEFSKSLRIDDRKIPECNPCPSCETQSVDHIVSGTMIVSSVGGILSKTPDSFRDVLREMKKHNPGSTINV